MKKVKSQWKQLTRQILALGLAVVLVSGMTDFSVLAEASQKQTAAQESIQEESTNIEAESTEVETVSGDTVAVSEVKVQEAEPADDEAGIAVYADEDTASDLIEVNNEKYATFEEAVTAMNAAADTGSRYFDVKLLGDVEEDYYKFNLNVSDITMILDLNGHSFGNEKSSKYITFQAGWKVTLKDSGKSSTNQSYLSFFIYDNVVVESGRYSAIWLCDSAKGKFKGGKVSSIYYNGSSAVGVVTGGEYGKISVCSGGTLQISGEETKVDSLSVPSGAKATVIGGTYGAIQAGNYYEGTGDIADIVPDPYVLISTANKSLGELIDKKGKSIVWNVEVTTFTGDTTPPTWTADSSSNEKYGIEVKGNWYNSLRTTVDFENNAYNDKSLSIAFRANDSDGMKRYYYYIQEVEKNKIAGFTPLSATDLDQKRNGGDFSIVEANGSSNSITISEAMSENAEYAIVIYAYAVDTFGNRSEYICTDGIVIDSIVPTMSDDDGYNFGYKCTTTPTEVTIPFKVSEDVTLIYFYYDENMAEDSSYKYFGDLNKAVVAYTVEQYTSYTTNGNAFLPFVKKQDEKWIPAVNDGEKIAITTDGTVKATLHVKKVPAGMGSITITDLSPYTETAVMIQAIDKAGNLLEGGYVYNSRYNCKYIRFQTNQLKPEITKEPSMTGIYGMYPGYMTITDGEVSYNGEIIDGRWAISIDANKDEELEVGTDSKCKIGFMPYDKKYETIFTEVVPTVLPKEITITFKNTKLTKIYGNELPAITADDFEISEGELAFEDTKDTIAASLYYDTEAADATADVGTYEFTVKSKGKNYDITVQYPKDADHGTVEVQQAKGEIKTVSGEYKKYVDIEYEKDKEFNISDWVEANYPNAKLSYEVEEDSTRNSITVTPDGKVKIHNAGTTYIRISLPESKNYTAADNSIEITIYVIQKQITLDPITKNYLYTQGTNGGYEEIPIMSIASLLPEDYGSIEISSSPSLNITDSNNIFEGDPKITGQGADAVIRYKVKENGTPGNTAQITLPYIFTTNYNINGGITINVELVDKTPTELQGDLALKNSTLTYGQALSAVQFGNNTFVDKTTKKTVPGTLEWSTPSEILDAGSRQVEWKFTPKDTDTYVGCTGKVTITVNKADPSEVSAPVLHNYPYRPAAIGKIDDLLSNSYYLEQQGIVKGIKGEELKGIWSWVNPDLIPEIGEHTLKIRFTPEDQNYNPVESNITLNVVKAVPYIYPSPSVEKAYTHGDYLSSQKLQNGVAYSSPYASEAGYTVLEGTFTWEEPDTLLTYWSYNYDVQTKYRYVFTPKDQEHYEPTTGRVTIVVNQAEYPPTVPGDINVKNSCTTLRDVTLPEGWSFYEADLNTELKVDDPVKVTVFYEDNYNYINTTKEITVTRSSCDHEKTERREIVKATCIAEGNTGYLWCLECNTKLEEGTVTPKDPTNHTALTSKVIKQPTTSEEGIMEYTCSACGYSATKAIAKIASTSSGSGSSSGSQSNNDDKPAPTPTPTPVATPVPAVTPVRPNRIPVKPTVKEEPKIPAPFLRGENGKEGWAVITETVTEAEDGDTVIVDMNGSSVVPGDVFDRIRGKDITVEFDLGNGILWKVNGQSVEKGNVGDIDFTVRAGEDANDTIPLEIINNLTGERTYMNLTLAYEGEFGFEAVLSLNVGTANAGLYANLFYYNEATKELEFLCAGEIGQDGGAELTFTHASEYTIVIDEQPMETEQSQEVTSETGVQDNQEDNTVNIAPEMENTGHTALLIFCIILIIAAFIVIGVIVFVKKNKKEE